VLAAVKGPNETSGDAQSDAFVVRRCRQFVAALQIKAAQQSQVDGGYNSLLCKRGHCHGVSPDNRSADPHCSL
jgi:hypothetical protein